MVNINIQPDTITLADVQDLRRFDRALVICGWGPPNTAVLAAAGIGIGLWRYTQSPIHWPGWPSNARNACARAVFANEPDIEGPPSPWYAEAVAAWRNGGGKVGEPPWSDEGKRVGDGVMYDFVACHCYAGDFHNLQAARGRGGSNVLLTEYGHPTQQERCLVELAAAGVTEETYLFAYRWQGHAASGYDLAGVTLLPVVPIPPPSPVPDPDAPYKQQWRSLRGVSLNEDAAIWKSWLAARKGGERSYGVPTSEEFTRFGKTIQIFTGAIATWDGSKVTWW